MLGYPGVLQHKTTNFTPVKGISWIDGLQCTGAETSIADCSHTYPWGYALFALRKTLVCRVRWVSYVYNKYCCVVFLGYTCLCHLLVYVL